MWKVTHWSDTSFLWLECRLTESVRQSQLSIDAPDCSARPRSGLKISLNPRLEIVTPYALLYGTTNRFTTMNHWSPHDITETIVVICTSLTTRAKSLWEFSHLLFLTTLVFVDTGSGTTMIVKSLRKMPALMTETSGIVNILRVCSSWLPIKQLATRFAGHYRTDRTNVWICTCLSAYDSPKTNRCSLV